MNRYIVEAEKNLAKLLDRAAARNVILLFDEADSVAGRCGEGGDAVDRYANMPIARVS